jgi:hypothetical protein
MTHAPAATDADVIVEALAEYLLHDMPQANIRGPLTLVIERLRQRYGRKLVDRALRAYERELRRENRSLKRQAKHARAAWIKRTGL